MPIHKLNRHKSKRAGCPTCRPQKTDGVGERDAEKPSNKPRMDEADPQIESDLDRGHDVAPIPAFVRDLLGMPNPPCPSCTGGKCW